MSIATTNPATGEILRRFEPYGAEEIERRIAAATRAARAWRETPVPARAEVLSRAALRLEADKRTFARLLTLEMGKTLGSAVAEIEKCAAGCRYYAEHGPRFLAPELVDGPDQRVAYEPLGAILAVMPWNFPFWQVFRFAAPAIVAGNVGLLKHASNVPQCALAIEEILRTAGAPEGVFQTLLVGTDAVAGLVADPRIAAVTLTGSEQAGRAIGRAAGEHLKKAVLELGGSDPFVVMPSADVEAVAARAAHARTLNNGQSCIAAKRFIVAGAIYDRFERAFVERMKALVVGDPFDERTNVGPLATPKIVEELDGQVQRSVAAGARLLAGGRRLPGPGNFYEPTVLADIPPGAPAHHEELFGPVASLFRAEGLDDALALANDSEFGLGASIWTKDRAEADRFARDVQAGMVFVNGVVASEPRFPFGGVKQSGYGRELGPFGMREFMNVKTVRAFF
jgi:succinate-semialdehyde dehydrogenase/glutarate-semialdehyde dehydrogenase